MSRGRRVAVVTLDRGKVNALTEDTITELRRQRSRLASDPEVRAVVLAGRGKFFSLAFRR